MLQPTRKIVKKLGTCDVCDSEGVEVAVYYGNIAQCDACYAKEQSILAESKVPEVVIQAQKIDQTIAIKQDVFNLATIACSELRGALEADPNVTNKAYVLAETIKIRIEKMDAAIFAKRDELKDLDSARRAHLEYLQKITDLRAEEREKLRLQDISYVPQQPTIKKVKEAATGKSPSKSPRSNVVREMAIKMGIAEDVQDTFIASVKMMMEVRKMTLEDAAKMIAQKL